MLDWYAVHARDLPWRRTRDPYAIWVSEIMLQQTQVKTVIPFWERWMRELPTIEAAANASSDKLYKLWEGLGYYTRVRNLQKAAQVIVNSGRSQVNEARIIENKSETPHVLSCNFPEKFDDVLALPGIGRYTAGAICSIAFNQPAPILDGNVIRVLTRLFGIAENPREKATNAKLWKLAEDLVGRAKDTMGKSSSPSSRFSREANFCSHLNQSLMELGALVCTPRSPQCRVCPAQKLCVACKEDRAEVLPNLGRREVTTARRFVAFVIPREGKFLVKQRPAGVVNAHLWEFPNLEVNGEKVEPRDLFKAHFHFNAPGLSPLCIVKHSITRYRITLEAIAVSTGKFPVKIDGFWKTPVQMGQLAFTSAHRRILRALKV